MPPDLKSSTTHSKPGQYTRTKQNTGQQNKLKDAGTRTYKIAKNTLTQTPKKANKSKCTLTKTGTKTNKHTHSNKDWGQYDQQRRPADPAEGTTVQPTKATIGTTDTLTQAKTGASTTNKGDQQIQQKEPQCNQLRRP